MVLTICHFRCHNIMATILRLITILVIHILVFFRFFERLRCETWSFFLCDNFYDEDAFFLRRFISSFNLNEINLVVLKWFSSSLFVLEFHIHIPNPNHWIGCRWGVNYLNEIKNYFYFIEDDLWCYDGFQQVYYGTLNWCPPEKYWK